MRRLSDPQKHILRRLVDGYTLSAYSIDAKTDKPAGYHFWTGKRYEKVNKASVEVFIDNGYLQKHEDHTLTLTNVIVHK